MSKKPQYDPEEIRYPNQKIEISPLVPEMEQSYIEYAMSVIVGRALPDVRDGLKPVHRRILYAMYEDNLTSDKPFKKSATCVGDVLGRYHPHGDQSVYDALVRLAQDFSMRYMLVDGHGNFGSVDGDPPAAYRYTEARLSKISDEMLRDIEKDTVDWDPNFDESRKEPRVLPARFPNLLVNGSSGIAVGMATNIPPHNLREVINATICVLDNPEAELSDLMEHGYVTGKPYMGVQVTNVSDEAQRYGVAAGAAVQYVADGSCAQKAGLQVGDIITAIDDTAIDSSSALTAALSSNYKAGDKATLTIVRDQKEQKLTITFDEKNEQTEAANQPQQESNQQVQQQPSTGWPFGGFPW